MHVISEPSGADWNSTVRDLTDAEWEQIAHLVPEYSRPGRPGRPAKWPKRAIINAILWITGTGAQWRSLPPCYPPWKTVHGYHTAWSTDSTLETICDHLRRLVREREGRDPEPSAVIIDSRSVPATSTCTGLTRGYDGGKKIKGRKTFAVVDTSGLLLGVVVTSANTSDNAGGSNAMAEAAAKSSQLTKVFCDAGFKVAFAEFCDDLGIVAEVVKRVAKQGFEPIPRRWVVERSFGWLVNNRRLRCDYERTPEAVTGFVWAAHIRHLLRRLTHPEPATP